MKKQSRSYTCGIASVANALEALGVSRSQREVARHCEVTPEAGTNETEVIRAVLACGGQVDVWESSLSTDVQVWLEQHLLHYGPVIVCLDSSDHWATVIGLCRGRYILFDPSRNEGCTAVSWEQLVERWVDEGLVYGIGISV